MFKHSWKKELLTIPNFLSLFRLLLIPVYIRMYLQAETSLDYYMAGTVLGISCLTDLVDGKIAREYHMISNVGKLLDPLADKLLTTVAILYMMRDGVCSPVVLSIILFREFAVSGLRMVAAGAPGGKVIAANIWGKMKTVLQMVTIILYYFWAALADPTAIGLVWLVSSALCWVVAVVTALSGVKYLWDNRSFINTAK